MPDAHAIIIGAGQCGLAMSRELTSRAIDHIVLDRGKVGQSWRSERWDSLRMLTPNWANLLPGMTHSEPDGYMTSGNFVAQLEAFAAVSKAEVRTNTRVERIAQRGGLFEVHCDTGVLIARSVVLATGAASRPIVPKFAHLMPDEIVQITPDKYRAPSDLPKGEVLVVGASATGVQLAHELRLAGRDVTLAVGNHVRLPRRYRGRDIEHWLHATGVLDQTTDELHDLGRALKLISPQLMGGRDDVDLNALQALGIKVVGRLAAARDGTALFSGGLAHLATAADLKMHRFLDLTDAWIEENGVIAPPPDRPAPTALPADPALSRSLEDGTIRSVIWATEFAPDFSILDMPVFDRRGRLVHNGGVCAMPGLYVLGLPFLRRRRSHHISGAAADARDLADHLASQIKGRAAA
ncbi:MAG: FAD-dependent oxidoreductase [Pseudomonadota bacterium]